MANEGALECGRRGGDVITTADIYNGIDRILQVLPSPSSSNSELNTRLICGQAMHLQFRFQWA